MGQRRRGFDVEMAKTSSDGYLMNRSRYSYSNGSNDSNSTPSPNNFLTTLVMTRFTSHNNPEEERHMESSGTQIPLNHGANLTAQFTFY